VPEERPELVFQWQVWQEQEQRQQEQLHLESLRGSLAELREQVEFHLA
jgi:hypothetical protein